MHTVFVGTFQYMDKQFTLHYDFGEDYPKDAAEFMFTEGNYSCDCNRSLFIKNAYGECSIPELPCGDKIELLSYNIVYK